MNYAGNASELYYLNIGSVTVNYFMFFFCGKLFVEYYLLHPKILKRIIYILWIFFLIFTATHWQNASDADSVNILGEGTISYITMADPVAFLSLLVLAMEKKSLLFLVAFCLSTIVLFLIPSRSSFYIFLGSSFFLLMVRNKTKIFWVLPVIAILFYSFYTSFESLFSNSRIFYVSLQNNTSLAARESILHNNLQIVKENLWFGSFMSNVQLYRSGGYEIHNYLSLLQNFGLFIFFAFLYLVFYCLKKSAMIIKRGNYGIIENALICTLLFSLFSCILARGYSFPYIWFSVGAFIFYNQLRKLKKFRQ